MQKCPLCDGDAENGEFQRGNVGINCDRCGNFTIYPPLKPRFENHPNELSRYTLSCVTRTATELGQTLDLIPENIDELVATMPHALDVDRKSRLLLRCIANESVRPGNRAYVSFKGDGRACFTETEDEFRFYIKLLEGRGWITVLDTLEDFGCDLTPAGWLEYKTAHRGLSTKAFVAMWFDKGLTAAWTDGIKPAVERCGFTPVRIDLEEHNEMIDDQIQAEINESRFLVADLTGHRNGVYFEAGYALGLGIPVIWTCRKIEAEETHFDTRQYNRIQWESPAELCAAIELRIRATIGRGPIAATS